MSTKKLTQHLMVEHGLVGKLPPPVTADELERLHDGCQHHTHTSMFQRVDFTSHSGLELHWKIECDALTDGDWACIAYMLTEILPPFATVIGVPQGGLALAEALKPYVTENLVYQRCLIVDDVLMTGSSMNDMARELGEREGEPIIGAVAFSRCIPTRVPPWITPLFQIAASTRTR